MQQLLHDFPQCEYPDEYLVARLRGRRSSFIFEQRSQPEGTISVAERNRIQEQGCDERRWLFKQLNSNQRKNLAPLFLYFEVEILFQCLRCIEAGQCERIEGLLQTSLLSGQVKQILRENSAPADVLMRLERELKCIEIPVKGLAESYESGGIQKSEEMIRRVLLSQVFFTVHHPDVLGFFRNLIDIRNIMILAKHLHWQLESKPDLYSGGSFRERVYKKNVTEEELARRVRHFVRETVALGANLHPVRLEKELLYCLLKKLVISRRVSGLISSVIEYLWQWHITARSGKGDLLESFSVQGNHAQESMQ